MAEPSDSKSSDIAASAPESLPVAASEDAPKDAPVFQMWPQTPLVMMAFGLLLLVLAAIGSTHGAAFEAGDAPAKFPMTSKYITYAFLVVILDIWNILKKITSV